tara:strand:+ start:1313 stop:2032 length:720 start_codon:yes stop_codon:yes gene_type:complete
MNRLSNLLLSNVPKYELTIPSTKKKATYRPFLVKEEKILLLAQQSNNDSDMIRAIKNIIESCVDDVTNVGNMPLFDIEYMFLQIRSKSVGEIVEPTIICPSTDESISVSVLINDIEVTYNKDHKKTISLSDDIAVTLKYPSLNIINENNTSMDYTDPSTFYSIVADCIEQVETKEESIDVSTLEREEVLEFVDNLTTEQFENLIDFFITAPKVEHEISYTTSDGVERQVILSGLSDFFG